MMNSQAIEKVNNSQQSQLFYHSIKHHVDYIHDQ